MADQWRYHIFRHAVSWESRSRILYLAQNRARCTRTCFLALICNFATNTVFAYRMNRKVVYSAYSQVKVRVDIMAIVFTTEELLVVPFPTSTNPRSFIHALTQWPTAISLMRFLSPNPELSSFDNSECFLWVTPCDALLSFRNSRKRLSFSALARIFM